MKTFVIDSEQRRRFCETLISELPVDGSKTIEIKNTDKSSTARQQRLRFKWFEEVAISGLGKSDNKIDVTLDAKWMFAKDIWCRDDKMFNDLFNHFKKTIEEYRYTHPDHYSASCRKFTKDYISIQRMNKRQHAEFLTEFQRYWLGKGVDLCDPDNYGKNLLRFKPKNKKELTTNKEFDTYSHETKPHK